MALTRVRHGDSKALLLKSQGADDDNILQTGVALGDHQFDFQSPSKHVKGPIEGSQFRLPTAG